MSVFTRITRPQFDRFFSAYALGEVVDFEGIADGIDNTNYSVTTTQGRFVLTLFESLSADELPHFLGLMAHLDRNGLPCPRPQTDMEGNTLRLLNGKPAALFLRLDGAATAAPSLLQCQEIGLQLASMHRCTEDYEFPVVSSNDISWCASVLEKISPYLSAADRSLIVEELAFQTVNSSNDLPRGVIHADLFRDNVLFDGQRLSGMLDFYSACTDVLLLDVAITANDWCCDDGIVNIEKVDALLAAYASLRPLTAAERRHWPVLLRLGALRFWLSRLAHQCFPRPGDMTLQKDPLAFRKILLQHRQQDYFSNNNNVFNLRSTA